MAEAGFFLTSRDEWSWIKPVRACTVLERVAGDPSDLLRVSLSPPAAKGASEVLLAPRYEDAPWPPPAFPVVVNLFASPEALAPPVRYADLHLQAIVELHETADDASAVADKITW